MEPEEIRTMYQAGQISLSKARDEFSLWMSDSIDPLERIRNLLANPNMEDLFTEKSKS